MTNSELKPYFDVPGFHLLAHRGLSQHREDIDENSLNAFEEALNFGATHIESDVHATKDGVAVLFHDNDLNRVAGIDNAISQISFDQLQNISLRHNSHVPSLEQALALFPKARFNLDIKSLDAALPAAQEINRAGAYGRVLVSSFDTGRKQTAIQALNQPVVTSASVTEFLGLFASSKLRLKSAAITLAQRLDAVQIPVAHGFLKFASPQFVDFLRGLNLEVHFWTINDPLIMQQLLVMGATGVVTDRLDLVPQSLRKS